MTSSHTSGSSFQGVLSHPSLPDGRVSAVLTIRGPMLVIEGNDISVTMPLRGLKISWGGANNSLLFLSHPNHPEYTCFTRERRIIEAIRATADSDLIRELDKLRSDSHGRRAMIIGSLALIVLIIAAMIAFRKPATSFLARLVPIVVEEKLGQAIYAGLLRDTKTIDDPEIQKELETFFEPLVTAASDSGYTFQFHIAKDEELNAFALPGGIVIVNSGTLLSADRPEEVLGVLAHELSHVTRRHMTQQVITVFGLYVVVDFLVGNILGTIAALSQGATYLLQQGFSREHEQDADLHGLILLERANIDPNGMVEFFQRVAREYEKESTLSTIEKSLSFLSTHPNTEDRINYLTERIQSSAPGPYRSYSKEEFEAFKTKLRAKL